MNLKKRCSCGANLTTKNITVLSRNDMGLWYNCTCGSTGLFINDATKRQLETTKAILNKATKKESV